MIDVIITSYNEPKATLKAARIFLANKRKDLIFIPTLEKEKAMH